MTSVAVEHLEIIPKRACPSMLY